jgi:DNA-binding response OmpR family regulator
VILIVDDEPSALVMLGMVLRKHNYPVTRATSGREALRLLKQQEHPIKLVISDISMPGLDGRELLFQMRSDPQLAAIPVIMCTGQADRDTVVQLISQGVRDYIVKPISPAVVLGKVRAALANDGPFIEAREQTVARLALGPLQYVPLAQATVGSLDAIGADLSAALRVRDADAAREAAAKVAGQASLFGAGRAIEAADRVGAAGGDLEALNLAGALMAEIGRFRAALEQASLVKRTPESGAA